jgi:hypothetical protein
VAARAVQTEALAGVVIRTVYRWETWGSSAEKRSRPL